MAEAFNSDLFKRPDKMEAARTSGRLRNSMDDHNVHAGCSGARCAADGILDSHAYGRLNTQEVCGGEVRGGMGLSSCYIVSGHDGVERPDGGRNGYAGGNGAVSHGDQRARYARGGQFGQDPFRPGSHGMPCSSITTTRLSKSVMISSTESSTPRSCRIPADLSMA